MTTARGDQSFLARTVRDESGCLIWQGAKCRGYGVVERGGVNRLVHRLVVGAERGVVVRHSCDNPSCINPEHLLLGTQADNIADAVKRNRIARGAALPQTKLTPEAVRSIRSEYSAGGVSQQALADKYGVHQVRISQIVRGESWAHI